MIETARFSEMLSIQPTYTSLQRRKGEAITKTHARVLCNLKTSATALFSDENFEVLLNLSTVVKGKRYRPWRPLGLLEVEAPTFSDTRLIDCGKVISPTHRPGLEPATFQLVA
jgi:hypothetical protein